jgi:TetR/AcrR family transcriptional regulator
MDAKVDDPLVRRPGSATRIQSLNRAAILDAALAEFAAHGFRGATIDAIAREAGMSKPNVLYSFRRKRDLYAAVLEATLGEWLAPLEALDPAGDPVKEVESYIAAKLAMSAERPEASRLFMGEILAGAPVIGAFLRTRLKALVAAKAAVIRRWVAEGRLAPVDPVHLIFAVWATTQHYADFDAQIRAVLGPQVDGADFRDRAAQAVLAIILDGVRPRG